MNTFLTQIKVNEIYHLSDFTINIDREQMKHLVITGKNGSGKTILIEAIVEFFDMVKADSTLSFLELRDQLERYQKEQQKCTEQNDEKSVRVYTQALETTEARLQQAFGKVELTFNNINALKQALNNGEFLFAFYTASRDAKMAVPKNPTKPNLKPTNKIKETKHNEFLNFLVDLKIQEALARNEKLIADATLIEEWFVNFEGLLKEIFEDKTLKLQFNYKDYSFTINSLGKVFSFNELSDGYSAIIAIVSDLILKMQESNSLTRAYNRPGIVVIDEPDTHLSLGLQRLVLPLLTRVFPRVQFIITTHSPFILSSLNDAVAFDLQKKERLEDLTEYSYEALAEGYFGVKSESSFLDMELQRFRELSEKEPSLLTASERLELANLDREIDAIADAVAPSVKAAYYQIKLQQ